MTIDFVKPIDRVGKPDKQEFDIPTAVMALFVLFCIVKCLILITN